MSEIISLQFGDYANFVGSHFWNLEDEQIVLGEEVVELDRSMMFRTVENSQGRVVSAPRVVTFSLAGESGTLSGLGSLHPDAKMKPEQVVMTDLWDGPSTIVERPAVPKNRFLSAMDEADQYLDEAVDDGLDWGDERRQQQQRRRGSSQSDDGGDALDSKSHRSNNYHYENDSNSNMSRSTATTTTATTSEEKASNSNDDELFSEHSVKYWSDYSRLNFHHKSMAFVHGVYDQKEDFKRFSQAKELLTPASEAFEEMTDRMRFWAEDCDTLQGVHVLSEYDSGFGGLSVQYMEHIRDDYGQKLPIYANFVNAGQVLQATEMEEKSNNVNACINVCNAAHCLVRMSELCNVVGSLSASHLAENRRAHHDRLQHADVTSKYQASALLAQLMQTLSFPYRTQEKFRNGASMANTLALLAPEPRKNIVEHATAFPLHAEDALFAPAAAEASSSSRMKPSSNSSSPEALVRLADLAALPFSSHLQAATCFTNATHDIVAREKAKGHASVRGANGDNDSDGDDDAEDEDGPPKISGESTVLRGRLLLHEHDEDSRLQARTLAPTHFRERLVYRLTPQNCGNANFATHVYDQSLCLAYPFPTQAFTRPLTTANRAAVVSQTVCGGSRIHKELLVLQAHLKRYTQGRVVVPFAQEDVSSEDWAMLCQQLQTIVATYSASARDMY